MARCVWMVDLGVGPADPVCVAAWPAAREEILVHEHSGDKNSVLFLDFFFVASVWYRLRKPKVNAHRAVDLSGSSCLASTELVSCGKACFADQNHNWTLYFWQH